MNEGRPKLNLAVVWRPGNCPFDDRPIELFDLTVQCPECATFYHEVCWLFYGNRCASLGCGGRTEKGH